MYIEKTNIKVIGNSYDDKGKTIKNTVLNEFKFNDGIQSRELHKFLENLRDDGGHHFMGEVTCTITIDKTKEH